MPATPPADTTFPNGFASINLNGGAPGSSTSVTIQYTTPVPAGVVYMKYGKSPDGFNCSGAGCTQNHWYQMPPAQAVIAPDRKSVTLTITDGGVGDDDLTANGSITDPGGLALMSMVNSIPTLSQWAMVITAALIALAAAVGRRRHI